ncbi:MAG: RagB/SusD family nutrient uptake outer membrane protein, partial [Chitinophagaceae bacterium]
MKKIKFNLPCSGLAFLLITSLFSLMSCSKGLDETVYSQVAIDQFYKTEDQAQLALNGVYSVLLGGDIYRDGINISLGDVTAFTMIGGGSANGSGDRSGISNDWNNYTWTADAIELIDDWGTYFQAINRDNTLIDALEKSNISAAARAKIDGQAKFLRALMYFDLVKMFGGVPLYIHGTSDL